VAEYDTHLFLPGADDQQSNDEDGSNPGADQMQDRGIG